MCVLERSHWSHFRTPKLQYINLLKMSEKSTRSIIVWKKNYIKKFKSKKRNPGTPSFLTRLHICWIFFIHSYVEVYMSLTYIRITNIKSGWLHLSCKSCMLNDVTPTTTVIYISTTMTYCTSNKINLHYKLF